MVDIRPPPDTVRRFVKLYKRVQPGGLMNAILLALIFWSFVSHGQIVLTGTNYFQTFDSLSNGLPNGWAVYTNASTSSLGGAASLVASQGTWSATSFGFKDLASTISNSGTNFVGSETTTTQNAATNRCLGIRQTSGVAGGDPGAAFVVRLQNTLGFSQVQLGIDFQMLSVQGRSTSWRVDYGLGSNPTNFIAVGMNYDDLGIFGATHRVYSFGGYIDNQSEMVWIRIVALNAATGSGSRDTFGIDNVELTYTAFTATAPTITTQPINQTVAEGETTSFSVGASGTEPFSYQWQFNSNNISGGNASILTLTNVTLVQQGSYRVIVTNAYGSITSAVAQLTVNSGPPLIISQPTNQTIALSSNAVFSVSVSGSGPFTFRWIKNGTNQLTDSAHFVGTTTSTLTLLNANLTDEGTYSVIVSNSVTSITSASATLNVLGPPTIWQQPNGVTGVTGETIAFTVGVTGATPLRYQWRVNGTNLSGATNSTFTIQNLQLTNAGSYSVTVSNQFSTVTSDSAPLKVAQPIAQWNFNSLVADTNTGTGSILASFGSGTVTLIGGITATFAAGVTSDSANAGGDNSAWNTTTYPAQGTSNKTAGVQFNVSTLGKENIVLTWAHRASSTASKIVRVQYSVDGTNFVDCPSSQSISADSVFESKAERFSGIPGVDNNPNFAVRIVTEFQGTSTGSTNDNYISVGTYGRTGTIRFDMVTIGGMEMTGTPTLSLANPQFKNGQLLFGVNQTVGSVVIQCSSNLIHWVSVATNAAPFTFTNNAVQSREFYRAILNQ